MASVPPEYACARGWTWNFNTKEDWRNGRLSAAKQLEDNVPSPMHQGSLTVVYGTIGQGKGRCAGVSSVVGSVSFVVLCKFEDVRV